MVTKLNSSDGSLVGHYSPGSVSSLTDIIYDPIGDAVWVTDYQYASKIVKMDAATGAFSTSTLARHGTYGITYDSVNEAVWVSNASDWHIQKNYVSDESRAATWGVGDDPRFMDFDTYTNSIWVGNYDDQTITKVPVISYASIGSMVSEILDTVFNIGYSTIVWEATTPANTSIEIKVRTSNDSAMTGAPAWDACPVVSNGQDLSSNNCVTDGHRYVQYHATLSAAVAGLTPTLNSIDINFKLEEE